MKESGNQAFSIGDFETAIQHYTGAIEESPNDYVLYSNRSACYASTKDYENALKDAKTCVDLNPTWPKGYSRLGCAHLGLQDYKTAVDTYLKGLELDGSNVAVLSGLAQALDEEWSSKASILKDGENLISEFQEITDKPGFLTKVKGLYMWERRTGLRKSDAPPLALDALDMVMGRYVDKKPFQEAVKYKEEGNALYKNRDFDNALVAYEKAKSLDPNNILIDNNIAAVYLEMGEYEKCLKTCQAAIDRRYEVSAPFEHVAKIYNRMAACLKKEEKYDESIQMMEKSLMECHDRKVRANLRETERIRDEKARLAYLDPVKSEESRAKGNEFFKSKMYPEAKMEYDEAIKRDPTNPKGFTNRAAALFHLMEYPSALQDAEKALELDSTLLRAWARKGACCLAMKDYHKAMTSYQQGLKLDPKDAECRKGLETTLSRIGDGPSESVDDAAQQAMKDPELQQILVDPQINILLQQAQTNPEVLTSAMMQDEKVSHAISKLVAAGVLKIA